MGMFILQLQQGDERGGGMVPLAAVLFSEALGHDPASYWEEERPYRPANPVLMRLQHAQHRRIGLLHG
jgi:hypothetical protein